MLSGSRVIKAMTDELDAQIPWQAASNAIPSRSAVSDRPLLVLVFPNPWRQDGEFASPKAIRYEESPGRKRPMTPSRGWLLFNGWSWILIMRIAKGSRYGCGWL